jgi:two-component system, NtrC family, sensor kinase
MPIKRLTALYHSSFRFRLFLALSILTAAIALILTSFIIIFERNANLRQLRQEGRLLASFLATELQLPLYAENSEEVASHVSTVISYRSVEAVRVRNGSGQLVADISRSPARRETLPMIVSQPVVTSNSDFSPEAQLLGESTAQGGLIGTVELELDSLPVSEQLQHFVKVAILIAVAFWLTVSTVGFLILKKMTGTLGLLLAGVRKIEDGDLSYRIMVKTSDETGQAADAVNKLAEALQQREQENRRLQAELVKSLRLEIDEEKTKYMAKLIQTNRMTSLGLLVSSMAHEINNPNGIIRLAGEYLEKTWQDALPLLAETARSEGDFSLGGMPFSTAQEEVSRAIDSIFRSSIRIERVVQNLRNYSLGDRTEQRDDLDLNRVANAALAIVRSHGKQSEVNIVTELDPELPLIRGNPFQLEQVVTNLLMNAIQALPPQGSRRVLLSTSRQRHSNEVTLSVRDEGHGIPPEHLPYLCEPFFSTRINMGGSGLGLYIANFIIKEHQGRLEFSSRVGMGSTVMIHLPIDPEKTVEC